MTSETRPFSHLSTFALFVVAVAVVALAMPWLSAINTALLPDASTNRWQSTIFVLIPILMLGAVLVVGIRAAARSRAQATTTDTNQKSSVSTPAKVLSTSHFKTITAERPTTRFQDVAGVEEVKEELQELVQFLRDADRFTALGARVPRGVMLVGPPGTGKTLLARAVAGEAGVPFISSSGSEFVELYVGVGASRVRSLFQEARKLAPCIVFVDEIDAVGRRRGGNAGVSHEEREQTLNQILVEMDGFSDRTTIIILAATNRADILDPALLRPGRFDRQVTLDVPDAAGRSQILTVHARGKPLAPDVNLDELARQSVGLSGADLENLLNEAAILAARRHRTDIRQEELEEALDRVVAGPRRKSHLLSLKEREITAYHEVGHALVAEALPNADKVVKISIISRGMAGGYTRLAPAQDRNMWRKSDFEAAITCAMGGHVAEELIFGEVTTGPSNDLQRASEMARRMVTSFGMSKAIGPMAISGMGFGYETDEYRGVGTDTARAIDREMRKVLSHAYDLAHAILSLNRATVEAAAQHLLQKEVIEAEEVRDLFQGIEIPTLSGRSAFSGRGAATPLSSRLLRQRSAGRPRRRPSDG
ncbi:MAG: ATP-dependent zinc metalloprotease FtsH [Chloroflexota bacterium]